jgi:hypothetical protein
MKLCEKCGSELSVIGRYNHPILGKKHIICRACYMKLDKIIEQWRTFVFAHLDVLDTLNIDGEKLKNNFENNVTSIMRTYGHIKSEEHSFDYHKNIQEHAIINENKQDLFPSSLSTSNYGNF